MPKFLIGFSTVSTKTLDLWLGGKLAGQIHRAQDGRVEFVYTGEYRFARESTKLSVSASLDHSGANPQITGAWLANLLPDNERVLSRWAAHFGSADTTAFALLEHMGIDCAGAVQIVPQGIAPATIQAFTPQSENDIATRLSELRTDSAAWNPSDDESFGRFSLGGAQGKFALTQTDSGWALPTGRAASSHIFKVGVHTLPDTDLGEYVTAQAASALGLSVASQELLTFGDQLALVSRRYDRLQGEDGTFLRIHQEDFCQALGIQPSFRYDKETDGPTLGDLAWLVNTQTTQGEHREASRKLFAEATIFNLLSIGTDAHAKNHSLLHIGTDTRMAPLYDLGSAAFAWDGDQLLEKAPMALRYGDTRFLGQIGAKQLLQTADTLGVEREEYLALTLDFARKVPDAISDAVRGLEVPVRNSYFVAAPGVLQKLAHRITRDIASVRPSQVEPFVAPRRYRVEQREWLSGRQGAGGWVFGRYR